MRKKLIFLSLFFALAAGLSTYLFLHKLEATTAKDLETTEVLVAVKEIAPYQRLTAADVVTKEVSNNLLLPGALQSLTSMGEAVAKVPIYPGEQIIEKKLLYPSQAVAGLSFKITPGKRAVTIGVDNVQGLAGLVKPGDRVDVLATIEPPAGGESTDNRPKAVQVVENVRLLAVNQSLDREKGGVKMATVSVEVDPREAQALVLAANLGRLHLALRSNEDERIINSTPLGVDYLFGRGE